MTFLRHSRPDRGRPPRAALVAALAVGAVVAAPAVTSHAATMTTLYVSPTGSGTSCSASAPCSVTQAKSSVEAIDGNMSGDIVVQLAGGTYRMSSPLVLGSADSGSNGHQVVWQAAPGQSPVLSGGQQVTGWTVKDASNNIYSASVPGGADSRQLYVDGALAPRAAISLARSDVNITSSGMTIVNPALNYLASLPQQNRIELESQNSFTDRYAPVQSISGTTVTMQQPAWNNNNWGYDTLAKPFAGGGLQLENSYSFLKTAGQWFLDPQAGQLYYKAPSGWSPTSHDIELPRLTSLLQIGGSYSSPAHDITVNGISFQHTTWLQPSTSTGYADQQSGAFLGRTFTQPSDFMTSCQSGCQLFEAARNSWSQVPAAVQVSAARGITFTGDTFAHLGQVGLGIGNDANAHASGVGLGASSVTVTGSTFSDDSGSAIVVGGVQPDAHHPSNAAMTDQDITIQGNRISGVAEDYKDMAGILSTYVTHAVITHNEVSNLAYDGIDVGWGWGANDPGGSQDYRNRGLYNYQPVYTTATTLKNTVVSYNLVHGTKKVFHDGGSIYNLSANPGGSIDHNYIYDNQHTVGLYLDEGSRYLTLSSNVVQDSGVWAFTNASGSNNTNDSTFSGNWYNSGATQVSTGSPHNNVLTGNVQVSGTNWPSGAQQVIAQAGVTSSGGGSGSGALHAVGAGKCLDVPNSSTTPGTQTQIWDCSGAANQTFARTSSGQLTVYTGGSQMCLDASGQGTTPGTKVAVWTCNGQSNQQWTLNSNGTVTGVQSGLCLDVSAASTANGALVELWTCNGQSNQQWTLG
ncbi:ricin-type beta-trefoil lectin domain protein [Actinacidiphila paucisporea]|uniref:Ricin-type beta-trefoil lectin domain-containing protein n=1 Tax=Actinacidiphila paucisporea TaxID=310782 RepID=A0A1M7M7U4_9ACTN|nr:ricin-type beta-trefoil lectin domain protein [Actinacidiphila paucisporea]SHM86832.1 Ricin-type beta-trefoil lectin domain-containing protein [Actinacidiphila paucisporea]